MVMSIISEGARPSSLLDIAAKMGVLPPLVSLAVKSVRKIPRIEPLKSSASWEDNVDQMAEVLGQVSLGFFAQMTEGLTREDLNNLSGRDVAELHDGPIGEFLGLMFDVYKPVLLEKGSLADIVSDPAIRPSGLFTATVIEALGKRREKINAMGHISETGVLPAF